MTKQDDKTDKDEIFQLFENIVVGYAWAFYGRGVSATDHRKTDNTLYE